MSALLEEAEARLAPLSVARNLAWWESLVAATAENEERRTRDELAWSDALAERAHGSPLVATSLAREIATMAP
jgi:hypothetical protein